VKYFYFANQARQREAFVCLFIDYFGKRLNHRYGHYKNPGYQKDDERKLNKLNKILFIWQCSINRPSVPAPESFSPFGVL